MKTTAIFDEYALAKPMPASVPDHFIPWVQVPSGSRTIDIGCGDGRFLQFCAAVAPQSRPVGLEISWVRARRAADKGLPVLQADSEQLPFASGTSVESQVNQIAGEGRWPVLARLRRSPGIGDWIGHKMILLCQHPRS